MNEQGVLEIIILHAREVVPGLDDHHFTADDSLRELGANSVDRSEIIMMTLESLDLNVPLVEVARAQNIGELARILHGKLSLPVPQRA
jgi:polyketide biosynthesis acyl carrier protein